jgi:fibronectin-binding autotransporter adhesin
MAHRGHIRIPFTLEGGQSTLLGLAIMLFAAAQAPAQTDVWNGAGANSNWSTAANWSLGAPSTLAGSTQSLDFSGSTDLAPAMSASYSANSLAFDSDAGAFTIGLGNKILTMDGSSPVILQQSASDETLNSGTLSFSSDGTINVTGTGLLSISSKLSGSSNITKAGAGELDLAGAGGGFSGAFTVATGTLGVSTSNTVLGTGTTTVDSGATLLIADGRTLGNDMTISGTGVGGAGAVESTTSGTATLSGQLTLAGDTTINAAAGLLRLAGGVAGAGADLTLAGAGNVTINSAITTGTGGVTLDGTGTTTFSGSNTYTGVTTVNSGSLALTNTAINGDLTINGGAVTENSSNQIADTSNLAINGGVFNLNGKKDQVASLSGAAAGTLELGAGTLTDSGSASTTFAGAISGTGTLADSGSGVLSLTGTNTGFTGHVALSSGTINASADNATGTAAVAVSGTGNFQVQGGVSLASDFTLSTTGGATSNGAIENISSNNTVAGNVTLSGASRIQSDSGTLAVSGTTALAGNTLNVGGSANTALNGAVTGTAVSAITKDGAGILSVGASSTGFLGTVTVSGGSLRTDVSNAFKSTVAITVNTGAILDLNSTSQAVGSVNGAGTLAFGTGGALTLGTGTSLLSGAFTGAGTLTLGAGTTLALGANFSDSGLNIVLAGGTLKLNGTTDTFGSLSISSSSIVDFGSPSSSVLSVNGVSLAGAAQLTVDNWANMVDYFYSTTSPGAQGTAPINQIVFSGYTGSDTGWQGYPSGPGAGNQISPVPEAPAYGALMAAFAVAAIAVRRRRNAAPRIRG